MYEKIIRIYSWYALTLLDLT